MSRKKKGELVSEGRIPRECVDSRVHDTLLVSFQEQ